jgi:hypothetical protein
MVNTSTMNHGKHRDHYMHIHLLGPCECSLGSPNITNQFVKPSCSTKVTMEPSYRTVLTITNQVSLETQ